MCELCTTKKCEWIWAAITYSYLIKLLKAADWGLMQRGTLFPFCCSRMNWWMISVQNKAQHTVNTCCSRPPCGTDTDPPVILCPFPTRGSRTRWGWEPRGSACQLHPWDCLRCGIYRQFCSFTEKKLFEYLLRKTTQKKTPAGSAYASRLHSPPTHRWDKHQGGVLLTFNLPNRTEVLLKSVIKFGIGDGFKITRIDSSSRCGKTTFTHTSVVSQPPFIKIRVS